MAKKSIRDLTREQQMARGPIDLPFLMLTMLLLGIGLVLGAVGIIGDGGFLIKPIMDLSAAA